MAKSFRIRQDTKDWFNQIEDKKPISTQFDLYYFCLMLGLATGRRNNPVERCSEVRDFVDYFIADYKYSQRLIIALLIRTELAQYGISVTEKEEVRKLFVKLVDPLNPTHLTDKGMDKLNEYSSGGYDYLREKFDSKPYSVEEFLITYTNLLREAIDQNSNWSEKLIN